ncbi:MAG: PD40 domain-containing protein, partial [Sedimentisphaerales bacterium]|nr:PD40 domain-containing protein [Sedimentisphaerales bacterium]
MKKTISLTLVLALCLVAKVTKADFTFGEPVNLGPTVNSSSGDALDFISYDGLKMYFDSRRSGGYGNWDIWLSTRGATDDDWDDPVNLGPTINTSQAETCAYISADGLELYFSSYNRPGGYGNYDIWVSRRETIDDDWGEPENLGLSVNSSKIDGGPFLTADGLELYFYSQRSGGYGSDDIWVSRRATKDDPWGEPENLGPIVNSSASESLPFLSYDGLLLLFSEDYYGPFRSGGLGNVDMWMSRRMSISDPWGTPV